MKLTVHVPDNCHAERRYIASLLFEEFLGLPIRVVFESRRDVAIVGSDDKELVLNDSFFATASHHWLAAASMPPRPLRWAQLPDDFSATESGVRTLPVLFAEPADVPLVGREAPSRTRCSLDVLGTAFYLITRYEELAAPVEDDYGRFPVEASLAFQEGFLDRPVVDEYVELLWWLLSQQWPGLERKQNRYQFFLSHDVDSPYRVLGRPLSDVVLAAGVDVTMRRGWRVAGRRLTNACRVYLGDHGADPYNTFEFIMSTSEAYSLRNAFYFITRRRSGRLDGTHSFQSKPVERLIQAVHRRGHEIGLHPGYTTYRNNQYIAEEFSLLRKQCDRLGVNQSAWGGRQHYLRWKNPTTWAAWDRAGLDYDSSVGYADDVGFRCGTCREYTVYELVERRPLQLRERPLVVMECALSYRFPQPVNSCFDRLAKLIERCRRMNGNFTLLWHNSNLVSTEQREWYRRVVSHAA
jgi:hypothetical protein